MGATETLPQNTFQPGYQIGQYCLLERFQQGGQSDIWSALDEIGKRVVAIKILSGRVGGSADGNQIIQQETSVIAALQHSNILPIFSYGTIERSPYIVMPYLPWGSVASLIKSGPLRYSTAISMAAQMAAALDYIHNHHIVHRDIKPSNFLVDSSKGIYLTDFGLAKALSEFTQPLHTGRGTAPYSSPEQHARRTISHKTDIYSLGIVLFELFTGQLPWSGEVALAVRQFESGEELPDPRDVNPLLPSALAPALRTLTAQMPEDRPATAAEAFNLVATSALAADSAPIIPRPLTLERVLRQEPTYRSDDERLARDAQALMDDMLKTWEATSDPLAAGLTDFCLLDSVYVQAEHYGLEINDTQQRFMLHNALAFGREERAWWYKVEDGEARVQVCEHTIVNQNGAACTRAALWLLGEPLIVSGKRKVSQSTQERLIELASKTQDAALVESLLTLVSPSRVSGTEWHAGQLGTAATHALATMALDGSLRALYAARLIGQMRSQDAVNQLLGSRSADNQVQFVTTLMEVRQAAGNLPLSVPLWLRWQVAVKSAAQEFLDDRPTLFRAYLASALAAALSLGFYVYSLYVLPRFLDAARILNAIGSGLLFGLVIGLGIFCARLIAHRLRTVAPLPRLIAATGLGGVIMTAGFSGYHVLFLDSSPTGGLISIASLVIALGFGVGALLAVPGLLRALISSLTIAAVTGLAWYLYLSTSVTPLLYFEPGQPVRMGFLIFVFSLCMGAIPHTVSLFKVSGNAGRP